MLTSVRVPNNPCQWIPKVVLELVVGVIVLQEDDLRVSCADRRRIPGHASVYLCPCLASNRFVQSWSSSLCISGVQLWLGRDYHGSWFCDTGYPGDRVSRVRTHPFDSRVIPFQPYIDLSVLLASPPP